jgi:DNA polymerase-1
MAKDTSFIKAFQDGADIHALTASQVLGKDIKDVTKAERSAAKAINFGILYGMGVRNLAKSTGFSKDEAKSFLDTYFEMHPQIQEYIDAMKLKAHTDEYVETLFGRRRYLPDVNSSMHMLVAAAERMAVNMPVQGTQADLVKMAMLKVQAWIEGSKLDVKMLLQVHDELVFEIADKDMKKAVPEIKKIMEAIWPSDVPLVVDAEVGKNWGDLKDWE